MVSITSSRNHVEIYNKLKNEIPKQFGCEALGALFTDISDPATIYTFMNQDIKDKTPYATHINRFPTTIGLTGKAI